MLALAVDGKSRSTQFGVRVWWKIGRMIGYPRRARRYDRNNGVSPSVSRAETFQRNRMKSWLRLPSRPMNASGSTCVIWFPSSSKEFNCVKWANTRAGTSRSWLCASPNESRLFRPDNTGKREFLSPIFLYDTTNVLDWTALHSVLSANIYRFSFCQGMVPVSRYFTKSIVLHIVILPVSYTVTMYPALLQWILLQRGSNTCRVVSTSCFKRKQNSVMEIFVLYERQPSLLLSRVIWKSCYENIAL